MENKILLTLDGSSFAERALELAGQFALQRSAELTLLQVVSHSEMKDQAEEYLAAKADVLKGKGVSCVTEVLEGDPVDEVVEKSGKYQLLIMTSHGRSDFDRLVLGSVTEKVVRKAECPVFVLRDKQVQLRDLKRILVPLDGFDLSESALPEATLVGTATGGTLVLCRVNEAAGFEVGLLSKETEGKVLESYLKEKSELVSGELPVETVFEFGSAARSLLRVIDHKNIDLVVMTSHGRGGFNRWVCGSVAENVLRSSPVPVLIVRPKQ